MNLISFVLFIRQVFGFRQLWSPFKKPFSTMLYDRIVVYRKAIRWLKRKSLQGTIVDIGCGYSILPGFLASIGYTVSVFDVDKNAIKWQNSLAEKYSLTLKGEVISGETLPCEDRSIDFFFSISALEHSPHDALIMAEAGRILKPNGAAYIEVPFSPFDKGMIDLSIEASKKNTPFEKIQPNFPGEIFRYYSLPVIQSNLLSPSGFKIQQSYLFPYFFGSCAIDIMPPKFDHFNGFPLLFAYFLTVLVDALDQLFRISSRTIPYSTKPKKFKVPGHILFELQRQ